MKVEGSLAANGARLAAPFISAFTTASPPNPVVVLTEPANLATAPGNTFVKIYFDRVMDEAATKNAFSASVMGVPRSGTFSFPPAPDRPTGSVLQFASSGYASGSRVFIVLRKSARDTNGAQLLADAGFSFLVQ